MSKWRSCKKINTRICKREGEKKQNKIETRVKCSLERKLLENCRSFRFMKPAQVPISIVRSFVSFHRYLHYVRSRVIKLDEISSAYTEYLKIGIKYFQSSHLAIKKKLFLNTRINNSRMSD